MANKVKIQPIGMRVVVKPTQMQEDKTPGGLILPPSAQDESKPETGTVVRLGTGKSGKEFMMKEGDTVFFKKYSPDEIEVDGEKYYILHQDDVLAIIE
ncbi:MAG: co-chaperone GroES [Candidatus Dojkabacteria bacterium]